jgi:DNA-binding MarR family transcriptional regulator
MYICPVFKVNESLGYLLGMSAKKVMSRFQQLMQENGLDFGHSGWIVLSRLWEEDGLSQQEISKRSGVAKPNISNYTDSLEKSNYLVRITDPNDSRNYKLYLTQKAKDLKNRCQQLAQQSNEEAMSSLDESEKQQLIRLLRKVNG